MTSIQHELTIPSIEDSIETLDHFPSVTERYFTERYCVDVGGPGEDHLLLFHSNRVCLITLAPEHPAFAAGIKNINFNVGNVDRTKNKVSGKGKKGGQYLRENSVVCSVECDNGVTYNVTSNIQGKLVEVNENLLVNPKLLSDFPTTEGHIAIALPNIGMIEGWKEKYLSSEQYQNKRLQNQDTQ